MKVTLNWLREFVAIELSLDRLADRLALAGLEVDGIHEQGAAPITVAQIVRIDPHPQSDHLTVCQVTTGGEMMPVVCGASNMQVDDKVALAPEGATLPGGQQVERVEIRGQLSCGMLCSERELGLSDDHRGLLILAKDAPLGEALYAILGLRDTILDVAITPNRGDCLSVLGLAREISALTDVPLHAAKPRVRQSGVTIHNQARVSITDADLCPRYAARVVTGVKVSPSPAWMKWRLEAAGVRALNNVVDVTNYVMLERGQPLHAFDLPSLAGQEINVRRARDITTMLTLDGKERTLAPDDLLICDRDGAVAVAGVMGGANSEVRDQTTEILLESAYFIPETVRRTARRLGLRSEASYRFERGVDPLGAVLAADRAASLLHQLAGGKVSQGLIDVFPQPLSPTVIPLRAQRVNSFLGVTVEASEIEQRMRILGAKVKRGRSGTWDVTPPSYRADLQQEADLIEEVARLRGYETIPEVLPRTEVHEKTRDIDGSWGQRVRSCLAAQGLHEMLNLSFTSTRLNTLIPGLIPEAIAIPLVNPLSAEGAEMRLSVLGGLLRALQLNIRQGEAGITAFELGKTFFFEKGRTNIDQRRERLVLAAVLYGTWPSVGLGLSGKAVDFADLKGLVEAVGQELGCAHLMRWERATDSSFLHPGKSAHIFIEQQSVGVAGALHPDHALALDISETPWVFELDFATLLHYARPVTQYQALPRFPTVVRDVAIVADKELLVQSVIDAVQTLAHPLIESMRLFDRYQGSQIPPDKQSLAYSISYRTADRTLTTGEVSEAHARVIAHLVQTLGVEVRA
ncbi:MAG: phenylalanine--tRNA ligase subunit beta [Deltaproteobacteria bacterium]|nr:phenylalanine--tRNA ligase subunit beta [Deltaproteobacteria bacterium]